MQKLAYDMQIAGGQCPEIAIIPDMYRTPKILNTLYVY